jgi:SPP1 gp7 family putative phage head morphogenesis protein
LYDATVRHAVYFEQLKNNEVRLLVNFLNERVLPDVIARIERDLENIVNGRRSGLFERIRYRRMIKELKAVIRSGMGELSRESKRRLANIYVAESEWAARALADHVPLDIAYDTLSLQMANAAIKHNPMHGRFVGDWFRTLGELTARRVQDQINIGIATGDGVNRITQRLMSARHGMYAGNAPLAGQLRRNVRTIVRTTCADIAAQARSELYGRNKDIIKKIRWVSVLDVMTSDICQTLDGVEWPLGEERRPPAHHQCRSTTIPIVKSWKELGLSANEDNIRVNRLYRKYNIDDFGNVKKGLTGTISSDVTFKDWFSMQRPAVQDVILGKTRGRAYRRGIIRYDQFFDNGRMMTLEQLKLADRL